METSLMKISSLILAILLLSGNAEVQQKKYDLGKLLKQKKVSIVKRTAIGFTEGDISGIRLTEERHEGLVWLNGVTFSNGVIEIDLRGQDVLQRSFVGVAFHAINDSTYDAIYFGPFNFQTSDSARRIHAVQYINHPVYTWRKLREEQNGVFENALINPPSPTQWFHATIKVDNDSIQVFANDDKKPSMRVKKLNQTRSGNIGLWVGDGSGGDFANLVITPK
jgi:hypothetical protein